jgi:hypothetical protein
MSPSFSNLAHELPDEEEEEEEEIDFSGMPSFLALWIIRLTRS